MTRTLLSIISVVVLQACGGGSHELDGSQPDGAIPDAEIDAYVPAPDATLDASDASSDCTEPMAEGCACGSPGSTMCIAGGRGIQCCGGEWRAFWDGPCWGGFDAGATDCTATPEEPGCPCATEGDTACQFTSWSLICSDGVWRERVGHQCC